MSNPPLFNLTQIILVESHFQRNDIISYEEPTFKNNVDIKISDNSDGENLHVGVELLFNAGPESDPNEITAQIKMVGMFLVSDSTDLPREQFAKINAPAIIFPFLREHLSSLSTKAGITPILLAPVNFVKHLEKNKQIARGQKS